MQLIVIGIYAVAISFFILTDDYATMAMPHINPYSITYFVVGLILVIAGYIGIRNAVKKFETEQDTCSCCAKRKGGAINVHYAKLPNDKKEKSDTEIGYGGFNKYYICWVCVVRIWFKKNIVFIFVIIPVILILSVFELRLTVFLLLFGFMNSKFPQHYAYKLAVKIAQKKFVPEGFDYFFNDEQKQALDSEIDKP